MENYSPTVVMDGLVTVAAGESMKITRFIFSSRARGPSRCAGTCDY
jgi:hypothetical protein